MKVVNAGDALEVLQRWPWWAEAFERLRESWAAGGDVARQRAAVFSNEYAGRRAAMVFDVVMSRRRKYVETVRPLVERFQGTPAAESLTALASAPLNDGYPFRGGEADTIREVAKELRRYGDERVLDDEDATRAWAVEAGSVELAHELDPYVGSIHGIGPALFAYMRMRAGGDAIKVDSRVREQLESHGFVLGESDGSVVALASACAGGLGCSKLELDQLLWWADENR